MEQESAILLKNETTEKHQQFLYLKFCDDDPM